MHKRFFTILGALVIGSQLASAAIAQAALGDTALKFGSQGGDVVELQQKLNSLGYWMEADGSYGTWTERMVRNFQADNGIKNTGVFGQITAAKLLQLSGETAGSHEGVSGGDILVTAKQYMGVPYVWGGETTSGFDCSGFTQYVLQQNGISIPRTAAEQFAEGTPVGRDELQAGDMVFFTTYKPGASHVGFYLGDGNFIHASSAAHQVTISSLDEDFYTAHYIGARRYI